MQPIPGIHHFDTGPFNWYLVEDAGRLTLVDAGFPGHYRTFRKGLASIGREVADVEAVIVTHAHADHTGFAARVAAEAKAPIFIHADDKARAEKVLQLPWAALLSNAWRPYVASMLTRATGRGVFKTSRIHDARVLNDGDRLDVPGSPHIIHTPGHTAGQICVHIPDRALLSSDTIVTRSLLTGTAGPPRLVDRVLNDDDTQAERSLDRIKDLGVLTILPGHGVPWRGATSQAVELARESAKQR